MVFTHFKRNNNARIQRGEGGGPDPPPEKSQNIWFLINTGPDPQKNHKATKPSINVGAPSSARKRNANLMVFRWRADDDPLLVIFGSSLPEQKQTKTTKNVVRVGPPLANLSACQ